MKKLLFILFSFFIQFGFGQNWELFPYGQRSFYTDYDQTLLSELKQDSIYISGGDTILYFNKKAPKPEWQNCYNALDADDYMYQPETFIEKNNSTLLITNEPLTGEGYFEFHANVNVGESWTNETSYPYADYDELLISFDSVGYINFLDVFDSVRYYSFKVEPPPVGDFNIDKARLIVSKNYGIIEYVSFRLLAAPRDCSSCYKPIKMSGFIKGDDTSGLVIPKWSDYFRLQPGDFLKFYSYSNYLNLSGYFTRKVSSIEKYADSVIITYSNASGNFYRQRFYKNALQYVLEGADYSINFTSLHPNDTSIYSAEWPYELFGGGVNEIWIDSNAVVGEKLLIKDIGANWQVDTFYCSVDPPFEGGNFYAFSTYIGLIGEASCSADFGCDGYFLVGGVLSGHAFGNYWPEIYSIFDTTSAGDSLIEIIKPVTLIYPNPVETYLNINYDSTYLYDFVIYDMQGQIIKKGEIEDQKINVIGMHNGMYILQIHTGTGMLYEKFIKM